MLQLSRKAVARSMASRARMLFPLAKAGHLAYTHGFEHGADTLGGAPNLGEYPWLERSLIL